MGKYTEEVDGVGGSTTKLTILPSRKGIDVVKQVLLWCGGRGGSKSGVHGYMRWVVWDRQVPFSFFRLAPTVRTGENQSARVLKCLIEVRYPFHRATGKWVLCLGCVLAVVQAL